MNNRLAFPTLKVAFQGRRSFPIFCSTHNWKKSETCHSLAFGRKEKPRYKIDCWLSSLPLRSNLLCDTHYLWSRRERRIERCSYHFWDFCDPWTASKDILDFSSRRGSSLHRSKKQRSFLLNLYRSNPQEDASEDILHHVWLIQTPWHKNWDSTNIYTISQGYGR